MRPLPRRRRPLTACAGTITITAEEIASDRATCNATFSVACTNLSNTHWFSKPDPVVKLTRLLPNGTVKVVSQLPVLRNTTAPSWAAMEVKSEDAANNDLQQVFCLEVWDVNGTPGPIGHIQLTFNELIAMQARGATSGVLPLRHPRGKAKNVGRCPPSLPCLRVFGVCRRFCLVTRRDQHHVIRGQGYHLPFLHRVRKPHRFAPPRVPNQTVRYLAGGLEINLACAIDFTASNGPQNVPNSLHFLSPHPNQ